MLSQQSKRAEEEGRVLSLTILPGKITEMLSQPRNTGLWGQSIFKAIEFHTLIKLQTPLTKVREYPTEIWAFVAFVTYYLIVL